MNLHIATDDKFLKGFIQNQLAFDSTNIHKYYIICKGKSQSIQDTNMYAQLVTIQEMKVILKTSEENSYDEVFFHSLPAHFRKHFLHLIPIDIRITWIFYGYEYYHRREIIREYLGPRTRSYYDSWRNPHFLNVKWNRFKDYFRDGVWQFRRDLQRINRFAHWNVAEYEMIKTQYELKKLEYVPFTVGLQIQTVVPDSESKSILLGHSGALTVNQLDGIPSLPVEIIEEADRVVIPLSYGASPGYKNVVAEAALYRLENKLLILDHFLARSSYFNLLSNVKLAWLPQLRGMGGGNILFFIRNNIPVALPEESVMYQFLFNNGFVVFAMEQTDFIPVFSETQKLINQKALNSLFGAQKVRQQYLGLLTHE